MGHMCRLGLGVNMGRKTTLFFKYMEATLGLKRYSGHRGRWGRWKIQGSIYMSNIKNAVNMDIYTSRTTIRIVSLCAFVTHLI